MSIKNGTTLTPEALSYLVGLIRDISGLDTKLIDDLNIKSNGSYSSLKISQLVDQTLKDSKEYSDLLCSSLIKLTCEKTTTQPTLSNSEKNVIYLYSSDGNAPFNQYLKISDTELIDMGSTSISLNDYLTITDAVATYCKKTDFDALKTEVDKVKTTLGTKVDKTDIVDNLTSTDTDKPLSANQGTLLKSMVLIPGVVLPYAGNSVPTGFLLCNGQAVSRTKYQNLFNVIGTTYGEGDGSTTFNLPNLQDKFVQGTGTNVVGTEMSAGLPNITGEVGYLKSADTGNYYNAINMSNGCFANSREHLINPPAIKTKSSATLDESGETGIINFNASSSNSIYGNSNTVQPPAVAMNYIIKY